MVSDRHGAGTAGEAPDVIRWRLHATPCGELRLGAFGGRLCLCDWADVPARDFVVRRLERGLHARFAPWPDDGSLSGSGPRGISDTPDPDDSGNPEVSDDFGAPGNPNVSDDFSAPGNPGVSDDFDAPGNPGAFGDPDSGESDHADRCVLDRAVRQLDEYFAAQRRVFDVPLLTVGTPFQRAVWELLTEIPFGGTRSYAWLAAQLGHPRAVRAVAAANRANALSIFIPCHRVVGSDGSLTGYAGGLAAKRLLLGLEQQQLLR